MEEIRHEDKVAFQLQCRLAQQLGSPVWGGSTLRMLSNGGIGIAVFPYLIVPGPLATVT